MNALARWGFLLLAAALVGCDTGGTVSFPGDLGRTDWLPWVEDLPVGDPGGPGEVDPNPAEIGNDEAQEADLPPQAEVPRDAVLPADDSPERSMRFAMAGREGEDFLIQVLARDFPGVFGIALRIAWDPERASLVSVTPGTALDSAGDTVWAAREVRPGSLAIGYALQTYTDTAEWSGDRLVATIRIHPTGPGPLPLSFVPSRSLVVDGSLARVETTWLSAVAWP